MLLIMLGSALIYQFATDSFEVADQPAGTVYYTEVLDGRQNSYTRNHREPVHITPAAVDQFRGIVRQAYDYSCGSAALTTLLNGYAGTNLTEKQTMDGLLRYGEYARIIERRSFSLLDMKRFVTALGYSSGGYRAELKDLIALDKPVIVPIAYAGFKHFVVYKGHSEGRIYVADPALGNISFNADRFAEIWDNNTLFMIELADYQQTKNVLALSENDMRHVDDATVNKFAFVNLQYPEHKFEKLADNAATMRRVLDAVPNSTNYGNSTDTYMRMYYKRK
ncbi:C39 family peptidase [Acinetobacter puyangensis]|uniref:putative pilus system C39 family peptidase FilB n=1 Tax=Acinetobacter puyangensis TaxID=1096779 RepID=UPI003A4E09CA